MTQRGSVTTGVHASADDVFHLITDIGRLPEWNAVITRVVEPLADLVPDREWVVELRSLGNSWRSRSVVLEYDATSRRFSYRSRTDDGNPSYGDWTWKVDPDADGSRVTVSWDLHPRTFWRRTLLVRIRNRQLRGEVRKSLQSVEECLAHTTERR
jgi:uncharacterized protein YndB with AHSA1/START domain